MIAIDAVYITTYTYKIILDYLIIPTIPHTRLMTKNDFLRNMNTYIYDDHYNFYICTNSKSKQKLVSRHI